MKSRTLIALTVVVILTCGLLMACNSTEVDTNGKTKVVFELEGGTYKNSTNAVTYWFAFGENTQNLIKDFMSANEKDPLERNGYVLEGWYRTKSGSGDSVTYDGKWDFDTDTVPSDGLTLYAKWVPAVKYTYQIYYKNAAGEDVKIGNPYTANKGTRFNDRRNYAISEKPDGYTFVKYVDENGNDWNPKFTHPGGETDCEVKVYAKYIEGDWYVVSTKSDMENSKSQTKNVCLANDIDLAGSEFSYGDFKGRTFEGNGHTISNFSIAYSAKRGDLIKDEDGTNALLIGFFHSVEDATVRNLTLNNVKISLEATYAFIGRIYVNPFCIRAKGATIINVKVTFAYECTAILDKFKEGGESVEEFKLVLDEACIESDEATTISESSVEQIIEG